MQIGEMIITAGVGLIGLAAFWGALFNIQGLFELQKLAYLDANLGRAKARIVIAAIGISLMALAVSFVLNPPD